MAFCKYICPIGSVTSAFSRVGFTWLSTYREECSTCRRPDCALACPYELNPSRFDDRNSMANCTLCMECARACDAVRFDVSAWSSSLMEMIPKPQKWEVWTYLLMVGVITFGMRFHHGLGRTQLAEYTPWVVVGDLLQTRLGIPTWVDMKGLMAMVMALGTVLAVVYLSVTLASRLSGIGKETVFLEIGYAFAPLMIIGSLSHALEFFFLHYYSNFVSILQFFSVIAFNLSGLLSLS
jgi:Fe-S-cluster-containing hydrogenase component 2